MIRIKYKCDIINPYKIINLKSIYILKIFWFIFIIVKKFISRQDKVVFSKSFSPKKIPSKHTSDGSKWKSVFSWKCGLFRRSP